MSKGRKLKRSEVAYIVRCARLLIEAHEARNHTSEFATLGEEGAMWELNFQLGTFRQSWHESPAAATSADADSKKETRV